MTKVLDLSKVRNRPEFYQDAFGLAVSMGMNFLPLPEDRSKLGVIGFACTPTPFPKKQYEEARRITPEFQTLYDEITCNSDRIQAWSSLTANFDEITKELLKISEQVYTEDRPLKDEIRINLTRNDFMLDMHNKQMVQIEMNFVASSFGGLAENVIHLQRYLLEKYGHGDPKRLPYTENMKEFAALFAAGCEAYVERHSNKNPIAVLFVVLSDENNEFDQRKIEHKLFVNHGIVSIRKSFGQLKQCMELKNGRIFVDDKEIGLVYFRAGYWPGHYEGHWDVRLKLEQGFAPKLPCAPSALAGMKIVQAALIEHQSGEHLRPWMGEMKNPESLSERELKEIKENPQNWVLKSQLEGSGAVQFDDEMIELLNVKEGLGEYVLMKKVFPLPTDSIVSHEGKAAERESIGELGIYGGFLAVGQEVRINKVLGHLMRSKGKETKQGGVFMGHAVVDAPYVVDEKEYFLSDA